MHERSRGQALSEFAIVFPVFMIVLAAVIQGGIWFWGQNTLTQLARDTARWATSQRNCTDAPGVIAKVNELAGSSNLIGYHAGEFTAATATITWPVMAPPNNADPCPPANGTQVRDIRVVLTHNVPSFFPFFSGTISTSVESRMEPAP